MTDFVNPLDFTFDLPPTLNEIHQVVVAQRGDDVVQFMCPDGTTFFSRVFPTTKVSELKELAFADAAADSIALQGNPANYVLKIPGADYLDAEGERLCNIPYFQQARLRSVFPILMFLNKTSAEVKKMKLESSQIGAIIGRPMRFGVHDDEVTDFRMSMARQRYQERLEVLFAGQGGHIPIRLAPAAFVPSPANPLTPNGNIIASLVMGQGKVSTKVVFTATETADDFTARVFRNFISGMRVAKESKATDFVLSVPGTTDYLCGPHPLLRFQCVSDILSREGALVFDLVERAKVEVLRVNLDSPQDIEEHVWPSIDEKPVYRHSAIGLFAGSSATQPTSLAASSASSASPALHWRKMTVISSWDLHRPLRFKVLGLENFRNCPGVDGLGTIYAEVNLYEGETLLTPNAIVTTPTVLDEIGDAQWHEEWLDAAKFEIAALPRASKLTFVVHYSPSQLSSRSRATMKPFQPVAWVNIPLFDHKHQLKTGTVSASMWPWDPTDVRSLPVRQCRPNYQTQPPQLFLKFDSYALSVVHPTEPLFIKPSPTPIALTSTEASALEAILNQPPLQALTTPEKSMLWRYREFIKLNPKALAKFVRAVPKTDLMARQELYRLLPLWAPLEPLDALELLNPDVSDANVRSHAVQYLAKLTDDQLSDLLLQLVEVLKFEPYLNCELTRFLLHRAWRSATIGHYLFWFLKAEMHTEAQERNSLMLEAFLRGCDDLGRFRRQVDLHDMLSEIVAQVKSKEQSQRTQFLRQELHKLNKLIQTNGGRVAVPLNPLIEASGLDIPKCKVMSSKMAPLWLVFKNSDPTKADYTLLFKMGDDLRQDILILQMVRIMDKLWKAEDNTDLMMTPYSCLPTGKRTGYVEAVLNGSTIASVQLGQAGVMGAMQDEILSNWLKSCNPSKAMETEARQRFARSCAGYCVATYVLGIGDRHSDNIIVTRDGRLVHIDFGHVLGNFKEKWGFKRERVPFVFTEDMAVVMGPELQSLFVHWCTQAYNTVRRRALLFVNLFVMMVSSGMPELQTVNEIQYLVDMLQLHLTPQQASQHFIRQLDDVVQAKSTRLNWWVHNLAQYLRG